MFKSFDCMCDTPKPLSWVTSYMMYILALSSSSVHSVVNEMGRYPIPAIPTTTIPIPATSIPAIPTQASLNQNFLNLHVTDGRSVGIAG